MWEILSQCVDGFDLFFHLPTIYSGCAVFIAVFAVDRDILTTSFYKQKTCVLVLRVYTTHFVMLRNHFLYQNQGRNEQKSKIFVFTL